MSIGDVLAKIKAGTQYVVQIPAEFQAAFDAGELEIMENSKTGKRWPTLIKKADSGKQKIVTPLSVINQDFVQGNPVQEIADSYHNILMEQQMNRLIVAVEETYHKVACIEHGQMDDRIGLLEGAKNALNLALYMPEGPERSRQITESRQQIFTAQGQIRKTLERRAGEFAALPKSAPGRFFRVLAKSSYLDEKDLEVSELQDYYELYLEATKLIAASYVMVGDLKTAEQEFKLSERDIESIDFSKVESIKYAHKSMPDMFYDAPVEYITDAKETFLEEAKSYDYIAIEVSGEELLEVIHNGKAEEISQADTEQC